MQAEKKIVSRVIIEILGAPKGHVEETMQMVTDKLKSEKDIKILKRTAYPAEEQENELWSIFTEFEVETKDFNKVMGLCFDYMPSSVEILEPAGMEVDCSGLTDMFNDLLAKLHRYDMLVKNFTAENKILTEKMEKLRQNNLALLEKLKG